MQTVREGRMDLGRLGLMRVKSISELAFLTLDLITDDEDELWLAHIVFDGQATRTGDIQALMKTDCGLSYDAVQRVLKTLVEKGIIIRVRRGKYAPNLKLVLDRMLIELQEDEGSSQKIAGS